MKWRLFVCVLALAGAAWSRPAQAACTINAPGLSISPVTANTGTYTPPTAPTTQSVTFIVNGTLTTTGFGGTCRIGIAWHRSSLPASMARSGGGATLPYTITSSGGSSVLYTGGGVPSTGNMVIASGSVGGGYFNAPFTATLPANFLMQPGNPQRAGSYVDGPTMHIFDINAFNVVTDLASFGFTVTGSVSSVCTIAGVSNPTADSASFPVSSVGVVSTATINKSYASVSCNSLTNVIATSLNGGVKRSGSAVSGFSNIIDYSAAATFGGATSNLNTSTIGGASGAEAGNAATTASATPSGSLAVSITPANGAQPLLPGAYSDTLRITVTAQ